MPKTLLKTDAETNHSEGDATAGPARRRIALSPEEAEGLRRILHTPESPTQALRDAFAAQSPFASDQADANE